MSGQSQHTPGPWVNAMCYIRTVLKDYNFPNGRKLATVHIGPVGSDEAIANGNLMAAAPELLEALKAILPVLNDKASRGECVHDGMFTGAWQSYADLISAAIARAEGRQP